jgi:hypothetical protein
MSNNEPVELPQFDVLILRSDFSAEKLAFFLLDPHPKMPNLSPEPN